MKDNLPIFAGGEGIESSEELLDAAGGGFGISILPIF
jgi:hypothetical protein